MTESSRRRGQRRRVPALRARAAGSRSSPPRTCSTSSGGRFLGKTPTAAWSAGW